MSDSEIVDRMKEFLDRGESTVLCTLIRKVGSGPRDVGAKMLVNIDGNIYGTIGGGGMERALVSEALEALRKGKPTTIRFSLGLEAGGDKVYIDSRCGGEVEVFLDVYEPEPRLIIIGSGHIAHPLAEFAQRTGFRVVVVDDAETNCEERYPAADIRNGPFKEELERLEVWPSDFVAIVHGETGYELPALRAMLKRKPRYIGLLGSRHKAEKHRERLLSEGFDGVSVEGINAPIGLDIGAETPEEIAISILAEIIKKRHG